MDASLKLRYPPETGYGFYLPPRWIPVRYMAMAGMNVN
jgi:hypothetical protein